MEAHIWRVFRGRERMDIRRRAKSCWHLQETKLKLRGIAQLEVHIQCIFILLNSPNKSVILLTFLLYMDYHGVKKKRRKKIYKTETMEMKFRHLTLVQYLNGETMNTVT